MATQNSIYTPLITLGGAFTMTGGAFTFTGTLTGNTAVTFPLTGTLATTVTPGRLINIQIFTGTSTVYTPTAGMATAVAWMQAPGGGSGGVAGTIAQGAASGGGGAGAFAMVLFTAAQIGASKTIAIPVGGAGGSSGNNNGTAGAALTFDTLVSVPGGLGGSGSASSASNSVALGANITASVTVSTGTALFTTVGSGGFPGQSFVTTGVNAAGGKSFLGGQQTSTRVLGVSDGPGAVGQVYGCGASGAITSNGSSYAGAAGGNGIVIVFEYS